MRFALSLDEAVEEIACDPDDVETAIAGNFRRGNAVIATRDLRVGGVVVVRDGVLGSVVGPSSSDSQHRATVSFSHREADDVNRLRLSGAWMVSENGETPDDVIVVGHAGSYLWAKVSEGGGARLRSSFPEIGKPAPGRPGEWILVPRIAADTGRQAE